MSELLIGKNLQQGENFTSVEFQPTTDLIALYFSASWCPPCQRFTPNLNDFFETVNEKKRALEIVFISSDDDVEQQKKYYLNEHHHDWFVVPFVEEKLRSQLKQKYGVCAAKEQEQVGISDRKSGIPTLVVLNRQTGAIVDFNGVDTVENDGLNAIRKWQQL